MSDFRRSSIKSYKRDKKELIPPLNILNIQDIKWYRDFIPEFLWIDNLIITHGEIKGSLYYNLFLDKLDEYVQSKNDLLLGTVSCFSKIAKENLESISKENGNLLKQCVLIPFGEILSLYPKCPMFPLLNYNSIEKYNIEEGILQLRESILRLFEAKDDHMGFCRAIPLNRFFKHKKMSFSPEMKETVKALEEYPEGDRKRVEALSRITINTFLMEERKKDPSYLDWAKYFWKTNYKLSKCE